MKRQMDSVARTYWLEITTGDLRALPVEGPDDFQSVGDAVDYVRHISAQLDAQELGRVAWADALYFHVMASGGKRAWYGEWNDQRHVLVPKS